MSRKSNLTSHVWEYNVTRVKYYVTRVGILCHLSRVLRHACGNIVSRESNIMSRVWEYNVTRVKYYVTRVGILCHVSRVLCHVNPKVYKYSVVILD